MRPSRWLTSRPRTSWSRCARSGLRHTTNRSALAPASRAGTQTSLTRRFPAAARVAAGAGQRRGRFAVGVAQLLGVDVVPAAAGQVRPVGRRRDATVGNPDLPAQVPAAQAVTDLADDLLVGRVARECPAAHRDPVPGDRHRDHHLRQVVSVVLGVPEQPGALLFRQAVVIVVLRGDLSPDVS